MSLLCLDFETTDPYMSKSIDLGPGWVYEFRLKQGKFKVLGWSWCWIEEQETSKPINDSVYQINTQDYTELFASIDTSDGLVMHNAPYDLGCLLVLGYPIEKMRKLKIYDTKIMGKLYNNQLMSHSLDFLSKQFLPQKYCKDKRALIEIVKKHKLLKTKKGKDRNETTSTYNRDAESFAYQNMALLQEKEPKLMAHYANQDTQATAHLYQFFRDKLKNDSLIQYYSYLTFIFNIELRLKGVRVSIPAIHKAIDVLEPVVQNADKEIRKILELPLYFNLESEEFSNQVKNKGYDLPQSPTGKTSLTLDWISQYEGSDELLNYIKDYRVNKKLLRDFVHGLLDNLQHTCPNALKGQEWGMIYPEINVLQAKTGRASSSHPNIQQIPNPEKSKYASVIRAIYLPKIDKKWCAMDWSNQEGRWQIHFGKKYGAELLHKMFNENPIMDLHSEVSQMMFEYNKENVDKDFHKQHRKHAKGINLGLSYGMGVPKLAKTLKVTEEQASELREKYNTKMPYLKGLGDSIAYKLKHEQYIKFFDGRIFRRETAFYNGRRISFDYKGINALMQGSGASQMYLAIYKAYKAGLDIIFPVHDDINIQYENDNEILKLKEIMEDINDIKCTVPMVVEIKVGNNWGELYDYALKKN